jgi:glucose-1-phosphate cytidylyltransferase
MQAVILCGGRGTRLHEETSVRPKPMVSVGDHPILWHIMRNYRAYGVRDFVLCLGYKGGYPRLFSKLPSQQPISRSIWRPAT